MGSGKRDRRLRRSGRTGLLVALLAAILGGIVIYGFWSRTPPPVKSSPEEDLREGDRQELEEILEKRLPEG